MPVQTQIYAKPRHQFLPSWVPRTSQHRSHHASFSRDHHGGAGKQFGSSAVQGITAITAAVGAAALPAEFDGKRLRKAVARKTVDYNASLSDWVQSRVWQRHHRDAPVPQPDPAYLLRLPPPSGLARTPVNVVTTKFVRAATNKMKCPVFCVTWTPEGRRLITGASSGEFTLWNGLTFNFETILQAHDLPVRCMTWSRGDQWMVTGDHGGYIKYWQSNMNNVRMFQGHKEAVRGISFSPTDTKFSSCSDDGTVRIWDFQRCFEEKILRGHGSDVKCVDWHPQKALIVSGSKDSQQPVKLWCPKMGRSVATIHAHKSTVMDARWNRNGHWLITASRDHLIKLFDVRKLNLELQTFRGHKREACTLAWHPIHEEMFASGGSEGSVMFWAVGSEKELGGMEQAHESCVWSIAWHPVGHILCTGSNDHTSKFWTRNRPGDRMRDRYNLNTLPRGGSAAGGLTVSGAGGSAGGAGSVTMGGENEDDEGIESNVSIAPIPAATNVETLIPGMGIDAEQLQRLKEGIIPGLDFDKPQKKTPHSKPIHKGFQQQWLENRAPVVFQQTPDEQSSIGAAGSQQATSDDNSAVQPHCHPSQPPPNHAPHVLPTHPFAPGSNGGQAPGNGGPHPLMNLHFQHYNQPPPIGGSPAGRHWLDAPIGLPPPPGPQNSLAGHGGPLPHPPPGYGPPGSHPGIPPHIAHLPPPGFIPPIPPHQQTFQHPPGIPPPHHQAATSLGPNHQVASWIGHQSASSEGHPHTDVTGASWPCSTADSNEGHWGPMTGAADAPRSNLTDSTNSGSATSGATGSQWGNSDRQTDIQGSWGSPALQASSTANGNNKRTRGGGIPTGPKDESNPEHWPPQASGDSWR